MSDVLKEPAVRPRFLRWSVVVFLLLLLVGAHSNWEYIEARRLTNAIDELERKGEPITLTAYHRLPPDAADTARYYRAAAALASGFNADLTRRFGQQVLTAERNDEWPQDLVERLKVFLVAYREPLELADRAAAAPFEGFSPGVSDNYRFTESMALSRLVELRAVVDASGGKGEEAADSLYSAARATRIFDDGSSWDRCRRQRWRLTSRV